MTKKRQIFKSDKTEASKGLVFCLKKKKIKKLHLQYIWKYPRWQFRFIPSWWWGWHFGPCLRGVEENLGLYWEPPKTNPFFFSDCNRWALVNAQRAQRAIKTKAQGSHISPGPDHRVKLPYFKHVWMPLAHQGERTVTWLARLVTNHYVRHPACEISPAGATDGNVFGQSCQFKNEKADLCISRPQTVKDIVFHAYIGICDPVRCHILTFPAFFQWCSAAEGVSEIIRREIMVWLTDA